MLAFIWTDRYIWIIPYLGGYILQIGPSEFSFLHSDPSRKFFSPHGVQANGTEPCGTIRSCGREDSLLMEAMELALFKKVTFFYMCSPKKKIKKLKIPLPNEIF